MCDLQTNVEIDALRRYESAAAPLLERLTAIRTLRDYLTETEPLRRAALWCPRGVKETPWAGTPELDADEREVLAALEALRAECGVAVVH